MARKEKQKEDQEETAAATAAVKKISRFTKLKILRSAKLVEIAAR